MVRYGIAGDFDRGVRYAEYMLQAHGEERMMSYQPDGSRAYVLGYDLYRYDYKSLRASESLSKASSDGSVEKDAGDSKWML